jgi:hypothetical protein
MVVPASGGFAFTIREQQPEVKLAVIILGLFITMDVGFAELRGLLTNP